RVWRESLGTIKTSADRDEDSFLGSAATIAFSPGDGGILTQVNLDADRTQEAGVIQLRYHERATGDLLHSLTPASGLKLDGFEFSPDGKLLASTGYFGDDSQAIEVWQLDTGDLLNTFEFERGEFWLSEMTFTSNETLKTLSRNPIANVYLDTWNVRSGERIDRISTLPGVDRQDRIGVFSPGGRYYFIRSDVGGTYIIDTQTSTATNLDIYVSQIAEFNATGDYLALESNEDLQIFKRVTP
ncbi:MAG: WD40 repeat domain-containing protein, partial [Cyanobacteriota bacterium]|nr:WD40 repeat domain-containing protein [Cyanobacteriota bacterium]